MRWVTPYPRCGCGGAHVPATLTGAIQKRGAFADLMRRHRGRPLTQTGDTRDDTMDDFGPTTVDLRNNDERHEQTVHGYPPATPYIPKAPRPGRFSG